MVMEIGVIARIAPTLRCGDFGSQGEPPSLVSSVIWSCHVMSCLAFLNNAKFLAAVSCIYPSLPLQEQRPFQNDSKCCFRDFWNPCTHSMQDLKRLT
jgi:hypothetical protein